MKRRLSDRQANGEEDSLFRENQHDASPGAGHEPASAKNSESAEESPVGSTGPADPADSADSAGRGALTEETPDEQNAEQLPEPVRERTKAASTPGS
jgi:hypothetical protein